MNSHPDEEQGTRRYGRVMILAGWLVFILLLTLLFSELLENQNNPNRNPESRVTEAGIRQVVLQRNRFDQYVASGSINGVPVTFLVDTGATDVALSSTLADRLGLPRGARMISQTANGRVTTWRTHLDEVGLGSIRIADVRASILPSMDSDEVLLGMSFLQRLELVQRGRLLTLRQY